MRSQRSYVSLSFWTIVRAANEIGRVSIEAKQQSGMKMTPTGTLSTHLSTVFRSQTPVWTRLQRLVVSKKANLSLRRILSHPLDQNRHRSPQTTSQQNRLPLPRPASRTRVATVATTGVTAATVGTTTVAIAAVCFTRSLSERLMT